MRSTALAVEQRDDLRGQCKAEKDWAALLASLPTARGPSKVNGISDSRRRKLLEVELDLADNPKDRLGCAAIWKQIPTNRQPPGWCTSRTWRHWRKT